MRAAVLAIMLSTLGCASLFPHQQDPLPQVEISGKKPPPGPDRVVLTASNIVISDKVQFETGSAELKQVSFTLLDEVVKVLKDNPQIDQIEIQGHTDSTGTPDVNRKLSQARAESVAKYIAKKGIKQARLTSKGFGPDQPIADNDTDAGREANRRVEFLIVKQGPKKTVVHDD